MEQYFVIEHQKRVDGVVNASETARSNKNSAVSLYHERISKMSMNTEFPWVAVMLCDESLNIIEKKRVETAYIQPTEAEVAQAQAEAEQEGEVVNE